MAEAKITSEKWVLDADLEGQKEQQSLKVNCLAARAVFRCSKTICVFFDGAT